MKRDPISDVLATELERIREGLPSLVGTDRCPHRVDVALPRRRANALNVEVGTPLPRCILMPPEDWPHPISVLRWLASGGTPFVLGVCTPKCCPGCSNAK
jgi:hypothetical protein